MKEMAEDVREIIDILKEKAIDKGYSGRELDAFVEGFLEGMSFSREKYKKVIQGWSEIIRGGE